MMKLRMTKIATAVATGLGVSVVGMNVAQADAIMFPYFVVSPSVTTIFSVINTTQPARQGQEQLLHYRFYYKSGANAGVDTAACEEFDVRRVTSPNDIVTFDVGGQFGNGNANNNDDSTVGGARGILYEPPARQSRAPYRDTERFSLMEELAADQGGLIGVMLVSNESIPKDLNQPISEGTLFGEAMVFNFETGAAWGYSAYNAAPAGNVHDVLASYNSFASFTNPFALTSNLDPSAVNGRIGPNLGESRVAGGATLSTRVYGEPSLGYDFSDRAENQGEVLAGDPATGGLSPFTPVAIPPLNEVTTAFFVTPIAHNAVLPNRYVMEDVAGAFPGPWQLAPSRAVSDTVGYQLYQSVVQSEIRFGIDTWSAGDSLDVVYDRDEMPVSGLAPRTVRCVARVDAGELVSEGARREWGPFGGWTGVAVRSPGALFDTGALPASVNNPGSFVINTAPGGWRFVGGNINSNQAIVQKLEYSLDGFSGMTLPGAYNTALWLKAPGIQRESVVNIDFPAGVGHVLASKVTAGGADREFPVRRSSVTTFVGGSGKGVAQDVAAGYPKLPVAGARTNSYYGVQGDLQASGDQKEAYWPCSDAAVCDNPPKNSDWDATSGHQ